MRFLRRLCSRRLRLVALSVVAAVAGVLLTIVLALADNVGGFEIDADHTTARDALYSGNDAGEDWAKGASTAPPGIYEPSSGLPHTAATDCYDSNVDVNAAGGVTAFICDGNSDSRFRVTDPEKNVVSPSGKTPDDTWPIRPGNVRPKNDFSHAYVHAEAVDSPCDGDTIADDIVLHLGGHVGDNEGDHFWGFEFDRTAPGNFSQLKNNSGNTFTLDFNRQAGDFLVSFTVPGNTANPVELDILTVTGFQGDGDAIFETAQPSCTGFTLLRTNNFDDVEAPPWNVPICDPTADNPANQCRLANGLTDTEDLLAERDFAEASVDLTAFGINPCVTNVLFTSRSAHVLEGADVQDVGGADFPLCGKKAGTKFHDRNANGARDTGDEAIAGWPIRIYQDDGDKTLEDSDDGATDSTATPFRSTTTGADGSYEFASLPQGNYIVCESAQPPSATGWQQSAPKSDNTEAATCTFASSGNAAVGYGFTMTLTDRLNNDFGNFRSGTVSGLKFKDADAGGDKDTGETGLGGWEIHLFNSDGSVHEQTTTASNGTYSFTVPPGTYTVCENTAGKTGWVQSFPTSGADCSGHTHGGAAVPGAFGYSVTVTSTGTVDNRDFGNTPLSKVQVTFQPQAVLPDGTTAATKATSISCVDKNGTSVGSSTTNTLTTNAVKTNQSSMVCTITYTDP